MNEPPHLYKRIPTREVMVGDVGIGGSNPIRIQSMVSSSTMDTEGVVRESMDLYNAGCEIVRITAPTVKEAENLKHIRDELRKRGCPVPLVADIHYLPQAAMVAVEYVEKIRINPGNFVDRKKGEGEYTDEEYREEIDKIRDKFHPLLRRAKELGRSIRIGVNHGSLSERIMNRFGNSPEGMVESAVEFLQLAEEIQFHDMIVSMKSSNPVVMTEAYRALVRRFQKENMQYPLHLGVTEAGDGNDGRIKSAVGIGSLLEDGIGDTIRVSLTEESVLEIPVARRLIEHYEKLRLAEPPIDHAGSSLLYHELERIEENTNADRYPIPAVTSIVEFGEVCTGGDNHGTIISTLDCIKPDMSQTARALVDRGTDIFLLRHAEAEIIQNLRDAGISTPVLTHIPVNSRLTDVDRLDGGFSQGYALDIIPGIQSYTSILQRMNELISMNSKNLLLMIHVSCGEQGLLKFISLIRKLQPVLEWERIAITLHLTDKKIKDFSIVNGVVRYNPEELPCDTHILSETRVYRLLLSLLTEHGNTRIPPLLYHSGIPGPIYPDQFPIQTPDPSESLYRLSIQGGGLFLDHLCSGIVLDNPGMGSSEHLQLGLDVLQAVRIRISKADYISCPSCGRTHFNLLEVTRKIKERTSHLKNIKIGIMGCIVNGPGEMADADFGYVGSGRGLVDLYLGHSPVRRGVPESQAVEALIDLIRDEGQWVD